MAEIFGFDRDGVGRIWRAVLFVERWLLRSGAEQDRPGRRLPRTYRRFTLTETLNAGSSAAVTWSDDDTAGEVTDPETCCYGLAGETGEAYAVGTETGVEWRVCKNPGQGGYPGALKSDTTSSPATVQITIEGQTREVSCVLRMLPASGKKYAAGTNVYVLHFRGTWEIASVLSCTVSA